MLANSRIENSLNGQPVEWFYHKENFGKYLIVKGKTIAEAFESPTEALKKAIFAYAPGEVDVVECLPKKMPWLDD